MENKGTIITDAITEIIGEFIETHDGDTNWLQIKEQKNVYMQFYSK